ncbi:MAG: CheY chemotaxis protein or a CheY-like REC (receiver) domain [Candidatus Kentron sp. G]|nr:MAG: CheY chemotaxis protein or a CheY-like REC (receiver) domain [Candidatus Kentron sp. G]VFM97468.1 MAG: CheY chemotaxis protein or a CheY-like REC (receiver) domain [Candidatus Kentron sp. G]VFM99894.1 MAG: CheY chemotaxis protein or a CheY-like REC (receiver) domain [Candidatus Kentron sp. G]
MATEQKRLLVIDDSHAFREAIELAGEKHGWQVYADDRLDGITEWLEGNSPHVVLLDWRLPGQRREGYGQLLRERGLTERTLLLSATVDKKRRAFVEAYGLAGIRLKPLDLNRFDEEIGLPSPSESPDPTFGFTRKSLGKLRDVVDKIPPAIDILDRNLGTLWSNRKARELPLTQEQYLIAKWLQVEIAKDTTRSVARRLDWDGNQERFLESRLYPINDNYYALERDWRRKNERPHDQEFFNLEEQNPTLENWLQAVAKLLAQRYAISRFRVYKIGPLPHTKDLEDQHPPLVTPKFQSGGGIEPDTDSWLRTGFKQDGIRDIDSALQEGYTPRPELVHDTLQGADDPRIPRVQYGERGTFRVLFPVRHPDSRETVALLAMDRRLDHAGGLQGFDKEVVELARRMASDEVGVLSEQQWSLMKGLVEDIGRRIATWLAEDERDRTAGWHETISRILIDTFADTTGSPEMIYEGISQVCTRLAGEWNKEEKAGERKISGHIRGITPWLEQDEKGPPVSSWCIATVDGQQHWRVVAGWGAAFEACRRNGGRTANLHNVVEEEAPWKAVVIQGFQTWSKTVKGTPCECLNDEIRSRIGSWLGVPMRVEGRIQALMMVHSPHACYFTQFHSRLMEYAAKRLLPLLAAALRESRTRNAFTAAVMHEVKNESHAARLLLDQVQREIKGTKWAKDLVEVRHYLDELNAVGQDTLDIFRVGGPSRMRAPRRGGEDTVTITLDRLLENATLGWRTLYEDTELELPPLDELAMRRVTIPYALNFQRVLRVLLHNAFRHGQNWVRVAARLEGGTDAGGQLRLTITNAAYQDTVAELVRSADAAADRPGASPLNRGSLGLVVARQLAAEAGGVLGKLKYTEEDGDLGRAEVELSWPVDIIEGAREPQGSPRGEP